MLLGVVLIAAVVALVVKLWPREPEKTPEGLSAAFNRAGVSLNVTPERYLAVVSDVCNLDETEFGQVAGQFVEKPDGERAMRAGIGYVCGDRLEEWVTDFTVRKDVAEELKAS